MTINFSKTHKRSAIPSISIFLSSPSPRSVPSKAAAQMHMAHSDFRHSELLICTAWVTTRQQHCGVARWQFLSFTSLKRRIQRLYVVNTQLHVYISDIYNEGKLELFGNVHWRLEVGFLCHKERIDVAVTTLGCLGLLLVSAKKNDKA